MTTRNSVSVPFQRNEGGSVEENELRNVTRVIWLRTFVFLLWERGEVPDLVDFRFALQTDVTVSFSFYFSYIF